MIYDAIRAFREGRVIPRHQLAMLGHSRGTLSIRQAYWEERSRYALTATFTDQRGRLVFPELRDVTVQTVDSEYMTLSGTECTRAEKELTPQEFAQSWLLCSAERRDVRHLEAQIREVDRLHAIAAERAGFGPKGP